MKTSDQFATPSTANALQILWDKASNKLTVDELKWFSDLAETASHELKSISENLDSMNALIAFDGSSAQEKQSILTLLSATSNQLKNIATAVAISDEAAFKLRTLHA